MNYFKHDSMKAFLSLNLFSEKNVSLIYSIITQSSIELDFIAVKKHVSL